MVCLRLVGGGIKVAGRRLNNPSYETVEGFISSADKQPFTTKICSNRKNEVRWAT